ncbi:hypothetical protein WJT74_11870 [Sphingomicrobium sp. XHP0239]|uniref:hypothetical protein n=1 Tax=Sphingomicrobium maritimum TaxID=3133972 RepID=UPI0031CCBC49
MKSVALIIPLAALALASCGETEVAEDTGVDVRGTLQDELFDRSPVDRDIALKRAIRGNGGVCDLVNYSGFVTEYENVDMWTANCDADVEWAIFIGNDDTAQIRYCDDVGAAGLPECEITRLNSEGQNTPEVTPVTDGSNEPDYEAAPAEAPAN